MDEDNNKILFIKRYNINEFNLSPKTLNEINTARKILGLKEIVQKNRKCISCKIDIKKTTSERLCDICRINANSIY